MNPLQKFILAEMDAQHVKRSELVKKMGYTNISKGLRKLDEMMETLDGSEWMLSLLQDALHIPDEKLQSAVSALQEEIYDEKSAAFKPSIWVMYTIPLNFFSAMGRKTYIEVPQNASSLATEFEIVRGLCRKLGYKNDISIRKGFLYHRFQGVDVVLDNNLCIVKRSK